MSIPHLLIVDADRARQFMLLGRMRRLFDRFEIYTDGTGISWARKPVEGDLFGVSILGPGWMFDAYAQQRWPEKLCAAYETMNATAPNDRQRQLRRTIQRMRLGGMAERLLWLIHQQTLFQRRSLLRVPDYLLGQAAWGRDRSSWPTHWRQEILCVLKGLTWLHLSSEAAEEPLAFGAATVLLTHVNDLRRKPDNKCRGTCPGKNAPSHHHYVVSIGRGFLGVLEQFAQADESRGVRTYAFPIGSKWKMASATLRRVGKTGKIISFYLPARLSEPSICRGLTASQHRLLQTIVRETTRKSKTNRSAIGEVDVQVGNVLPTANGKAIFVCSLLNRETPYVTFGGNKLRKGLGYRLLTPGGWLAKAGYAKDIALFLRDLGVLAHWLGLIAVGIVPTTSKVSDIDQLQGLGKYSGVHGLLQQVHLRIFSRADYMERWNAYFRWQHPQTAENATSTSIQDLISALHNRKIAQRTLAKCIGVDPSFLSKLMRGRKPWPRALFE